MSEAGLTDSAVRLHSLPEITQFHGGRGWVKLIKPPAPVPIFCCVAGGNELRMDCSLLEMGLDWEWTGAEKFTFHWKRTHAFFSNWNWPYWSKMLWIYSWLGEKDFENKVSFQLRVTGIDRVDFFNWYFIIYIYFCLLNTYTRSNNFIRQAVWTTFQEYIVLFFEDKQKWINFIN